MNTPRFKTAKIFITTLRISTGQMETSQVTAGVWRGLAVHEAIGRTTLDKQPVYSITHIVSGRQISPLFFDRESSAKSAAVAFAALPVNWETGDREQFKLPGLKDVIISISVLCDGFVMESAIDQPGGHA
ncbi:hypothetical protein [Mesorhizobium sp. M0715]|uniref:hypothetical protein n=1 Tax=Mesorhizobium sp. M0715 TaxID=2956990 RepID=UPI003338741C